MKQIIKKELIRLEDLGMKYPKETSKEKRRYGLYKCHCGKEFETIISDVKSGRVSSCGCNRINHTNKRRTKHSLANHRLYQTWNGMMQRCNNPKRKDYKDYGGRGISVCDRWLDINNFINDMYPSYTEGLTLDRINNDGNYEPNNCRWVDRFVQAQNSKVIRVGNKSGYKGVNWYKNTNRWLAGITVNDKRICLGYFKNI